MGQNNFPGHRFATQIHIQTQIRTNTPLPLATKHLMIINKDNLYLNLKIFQKHLVSSFCVTLFFGRQTYISCFTTSSFQSDKYPWKPKFSNDTKLKQKISNWIQRLFKKSYFEIVVRYNFSVVDRSIRQSCFTMLIFHLDDYHWQPNFSNHIKFKLKTSK